MSHITSVENPLLTCSIVAILAGMKIYISRILCTWSFLQAVSGQNREEVRGGDPAAGADQYGEGADRQVLLSCDFPLYLYIE